MGIICKAISQKKKTNKQKNNPNYLIYISQSN